MNTLIHADIFFFITTIAVIIFLILGVIVFIYIIGILRNIKKASDIIGEKIEAASQSADSLYHSIKQSFLFSLLFGKKKRAAHKKE